MGYQLSNYSFNGIPVSSAYLRIRNSSIQKGLANIITDIYASKSAYLSEVQPIESRDFIFEDSNPNATNLFSSNFSVVPGTPPSGFSVPTTVVDIEIAQSYLALPVHPDAQTLLSGAVAE